LNKATIEIDFNHPLAGKPIVFRAKVLSVLPPGATAVSLS